MRVHHVSAVFLVIAAMAGTWVWARSTSTKAPATPTAAGATLSVEAGRPGATFARGAVGLSLEAHELDSGRITSAHSRLVRLMRLLGPSVLRIGGGSVDLAWWTSNGEAAPQWARSTITPADLSSLHGLLRATGWRVLLGVNLGHYEPSRAADEARYAKRILGSELAGIEIGNEPNDYGHTPPALRPSTYSIGEYLHEAATYDQALTAAAPGVDIAGPALTKANAWLVEMGTDAHMFDSLTQHYYPIKACGPAALPSNLKPTAAELLSPAVRAEEDQLLGVLAGAGARVGRSTRIGETNSVACPGNTDASPAFAGALWALDWALRAGSSGAVGVNFHGDLGVCRVYTESPICASGFKAARAGELLPTPEYYGLLAAEQLEGGRFVPTRLSGSSLTNMTAWATVSSKGTIRIALDNFSSTGRTQPVSVSTSGYVVFEQTLSASSLEADTHIALGGASVTASGQWRPRRARALRAPRSPRSVRVLVSPASAVILTLRPRSLSG
ncbi:MAG: hypothetical protein ACYDHN_07355 [Solirubrobacteraceae bacterium]